MANAVLGFGLLMAAAGAYSMYFGYQIVHDERGWATFIAGAVLVAGGAIVLALGLVVRLLKTLQVSIGSGAAAVLPSDVSIASPGHLTTPGPLASERQAGALPTDHAESIDDVWHPETETERASAEWADAERPDSDIPAPELQGEGGRDEARQAATPDADAKSPQEPQAVDASPQASSKAAPLVVQNLERHTATHEPAIDPQETTQSDLALEPTFEDAPPTAGPLPEPEDSDMQHPDRAPPLRSVPATSATVATALEPPPPAVIGRYEADGTSYVMYADGSIEAQSASGVYRFASMAELKAFIEG